MAVGQLAHLADTVTLSTNSSASATIPNDGSVIVGDLLLAACVMPSGSRTFAISGGGGAWTSLGTAMQSGHMSQLWWRIAEAGDLGALVTVTPSTGNIRQVLFLGAVRGVLASSPVTVATNTSTTATTKTTPSLGSVGASSREVGVVWDSRGATSPNTSSWTAPSGHTRRGQAFTTAGSGACSGAWGDSDATVSGTIGSRVWTADQTALGSAWTLAIAPGEQTVSPGRIESTASIPTPTLLPGVVTAAVALLASTVVIYAPTLAPGTVTVSPARVESTAVLHAPTLSPGAVTVSPARIASTAVLYAPTVSLFDPDVTLTISAPHAAWAVSAPSSSWEVGTPW